MKQNISAALRAVRGSTKRQAVVALAIVLTLSSVANVARAAFTAPSVQLDNQNTSSAATNPGTAAKYTFSGTGSAATAVKRFEFQYQSTQGTDGCSTGQSTASAAFGTTTGLGGLTWTVDNAGSATCLVKFTQATGNASNAAFTFRFDAINNGTATGTHFLKVTTYDATTGGSVVDTSTVAYVIADSSVAVTGTVGETLTFSISSNTVAFNSSNPMSSGVLYSGSPAHTFTVGTNAANGYDVRGAGSTLTNGSFTIPFTTSGTNVTSGSGTYGITYSGGLGNPSSDRGSTIGAAGGEVIATKATPSSGDTTTATYHASVSNIQQPGLYTSNITYTATGKF